MDSPHTFVSKQRSRNTIHYAPDDGPCVRPYNLYSIGGSGVTRSGDKRPPKHTTGISQSARTSVSTPCTTPCAIFPPTPASASAATTTGLWQRHPLREEVSESPKRVYMHFWRQQLRREAQRARAMDDLDVLSTEALEGSQFEAAIRLELGAAQAEYEMERATTRQAAWKTPTGFSGFIPAANTFEKSLKKLQDDQDEMLCQRKRDAQRTLKVAQIAHVRHARLSAGLPVTRLASKRMLEEERLCRALSATPKHCTLQQHQSPSRRRSTTVCDLSAHDAAPAKPIVGNPMDAAVPPSPSRKAVGFLPKGATADASSVIGRDDDHNGHSSDFIVSDTSSDASVTEFFSLDFKPAAIIDEYTSSSPPKPRPVPTRPTPARPQSATVRRPPSAIGMDCVRPKRPLSASSRTAASSKSAVSCAADDVSFRPTPHTSVLERPASVAEHLAQHASVLKTSSFFSCFATTEQPMRPSSVAACVAASTPRGTKASSPRKVSLNSAVISMTPTGSGSALQKQRPHSAGWARTSSSHFGGKTTSSLGYSASVMTSSLTPNDGVANKGGEINTNFFVPTRPSASSRPTTATRR